MTERKNADIGKAWLSDSSLVLGYIREYTEYTTTMQSNDWHDGIDYFICHESRVSEVFALPVAEAKKLIGNTEHDYLYEEHIDGRYFAVIANKMSKKGTIWQSNLYPTKHEIVNQYDKELSEGTMKLIQVDIGAHNDCM